MAFTGYSFILNVHINLRNAGSAAPGKRMAQAVMF